MTLQHKVKVLDCKSSQNEYLHKDFHGALCYAIKYLDEKLGPDATSEYLKQIGKEVFSHLIAAIKSDGLIAIDRHFKKIFELENGKADFQIENNQLTINVSKCPAISHLKSTGQLFTDRYCLTTVILNKTVCEQAGYKCSCRYKPYEGKCIQKFWKE
ncbi:MAG: hypothetical protein A2Y12_17040 [Planctomycetes bacterium GWF2_42_9]|nr:MAG: hypothetical protein A2Y12_17040 [Planctomycetes bacterium GWF2_42_9]